MAEVERQDQEVQIPGRFEAFYREEYPAVVALVYGLTGTAWSAEDLAQEAFLRAHNDWTRVGGMEAPSAWVKRVALNLAVSRFRKLRSEAAATLRLTSDVTSVQPPTAESQAFWQEVRRLPRRQSQVLNSCLGHAQQRLHSYGPRYRPTGLELPGSGQRRRSRHHSRRRTPRRELGPGNNRA
jgi:DNA-directed RNA polymerase specialized sigma24 family protein